VTLRTRVSARQSAVSRLRRGLLADQLAPDVLITDVRMPPTFTLEGLRAALELRVRSPQIAVLVLSQHLETRYAVELLGEGASGVGYLLKERVTAVDEFISAGRRVVCYGHN
jgi:DNA-binding NarL/FixJ family response regulator